MGNEGVLSTLEVVGAQQSEISRNELGFSDPHGQIISGYPQTSENLLVPPKGL